MNSHFVTKTSFLTTPLTPMACCPRIALNGHEAELHFICERATHSRQNQKANGQGGMWPVAVVAPKNRKPQNKQHKSMKNIKGSFQAKQMKASKTTSEGANKKRKASTKKQEISPYPV